MQGQDLLIQRLDFTNTEKSTGASINVSYKVAGGRPNKFTTDFITCSVSKKPKAKSISLSSPPLRT